MCNDAFVEKYGLSKIYNTKCYNTLCCMFNSRKPTNCDIYGRKPEECRLAKEFNRMTESILIDRDHDSGCSSYHVWTAEIVENNFK